MSGSPSLGRAARALHVAMLSEIVDEHRSPGNRRVHLAASALGYASIVAMASAAAVPGAAGEIVHLGSLIVFATLVFFLPLDALSAGLAAAIGAGAVLGADSLSGASPWVRLGVPFGVLQLSNFVLLGAHGVFNEPFTARRPKRAAYRVFRAVYNQVFGVVHYLLLGLFELGWRPRLQREVAAAAKSFGLRNRHPWQSWAGLARCEPVTCFYPETVEDLEEIVREAIATGRRIRAAGSGHSFSALSPTDDFLVLTKRMKGVWVDTSDPARPRVTVEPGVTNRELNDALEAHGLALPFNVVLESVCVAALVCTGSHGSGRDNPTLSDLVESMEVVTGTGERRVFSAERDPAEVMRAARLHLGLFGLVSKVTLRVVPSFRVVQRDSRAKVDETLRDLPELVARHDSLDLFWWPFNEEVWIKTLDRTGAEVTAAPRKQAFEWHVTRVLVGLSKLLARLAMGRPSWTPWFCRKTFAGAPRGTQVVAIVDGVHHRRAIEALFCRCLEVAIPIDPGFERVREAWSAVVELTEQWAKEGRYPFNLTLNARFVAGSDALLSPAFGNERTCYIEILSYAGTPGWDDFARAVAARWMAIPGARPHWAKELAPIPGGAAGLRAAFGEGLARFNHVRRALRVDPHGVFTNDLTGAVFDAEEAAVSPTLVEGA